MTREIVRNEQDWDNLVQKLRKHARNFHPVDADWPNTLPFVYTYSEEETEWSNPIIVGHVDTIDSLESLLTQLRQSA